jgi:X-Pro dipeptidyl-peptidase
MRRAAPRLRTLAILAGLVAAALPALPAQAAVVTEKYFVPTVGGAVIRVEVTRDPAFDPQPVILTYSPYNSLSGVDDPSADGTATRYNPRGFARAAADVLGTRGSTGCWDYGGPMEQQSGVDVVKFLAGKRADTAGNFISWSNGKVAMTGVSYDGTTANMVAATGIPELKAIVPVAAISRWYGYAYHEGIRYLGNSREPIDEGFDTPLLFTHGFARTVPQDDPAMAQHRVVACEDEYLTHAQQGYSRAPNYTQFWRERDYRKDADSFRAAVLVVHGWQDYNVKQDEGLALYEAIPVDDPETEDVIEGVPFKLLWMTQGPHGGGSGPGYQTLVDRFFEQTLKGEDHGLEDLATPVMTLGRSAMGANPAYTPEESWPPVGTKDVSLYLGRSFDCVPGAPCAGVAGSTGEYGWLAATPQSSGTGWAHANPGTISEELTLNDPANREMARPNGQVVRGHGYVSLFQESPPLARDTRIAGRAVLDTWVNPLTASQHLTPILVEVLADGTLELVERGFLNLDYRNGLAQAEPATGWQHAKVTFLPQDYTFEAGSRIGLILQASNTVWAVPGNPGMLSYSMGGSVPGQGQVGTSLILPLVDPPSNPAALFGS